MKKRIKLETLNVESFTTVSVSSLRGGGRPICTLPNSNCSDKYACDTTI
ncbi:hypothetical protein AB9P05_19415 [Roseivirga sp. BDSF3-8]